MGPDGTRRIYFRDTNGDLMLDKWLEISGFPGIGSPTRRENGAFIWERQGFDLSIGAHGPQLRKLLTLRNQNISTEWSFNVGLHNLQLDRSSVPWLIKDGDIVVAELSRPWASDAVGTHRFLTVNLSAGVLSLSLDTIGLIYPLTVDPTVNLQVGAGADDAICYDTTWYADLTAFRIGAGGDPGRDAILRFTNVTIPNGATVNAATLKLTAAIADVGDTVRLNIAAEDADNPAVPTSCADLAGRVRTSASVPWDFTTDWVIDTEYSPGDLAAVIQELVDRGGWSSGNALNIIIDDDGSDGGAFRRAYSYEGSTAKAAKLDITYTATQTGSITADAIIKATQSASLTADAIVKAAAGSSFTADSIVKGTQSSSFTADASIKRIVSSSITADAIVYATTGSSITGDAIVLKTASASVTADAIILAVQTDSLTADALIFNTASASITADAIVFATQTGSLTAGAFISKPITADAAIKAEQTASITADATIKSEQSSSFTADTIILTVETGSFTVDAYIKKVVLADAIILRHRSGSLAVDAYIEWYSVYPEAYDDWTTVANVAPLVGDSGTDTDKAWMSPVQRAIIDIQHAMGINPQGSYASVAARVAAIWAKMQTMGFGDFTADAIIIKTMSSSITADAIVLVTQASDFTADSIVRTVNSSSFTADAFLCKTFTADAIVRAVQSSSITADAIVVKTIGGSFTADAVIS